MPKLIGLCGRKGSGKSTAGRILCEKYGMCEIAFADPLKRGIQALFGFTEDQLWGANKDVVDKDWGVTPRTLLQYIGTDVFREEIPRAFGWDATDPRRSPWVFQLEREVQRIWRENPCQRIVVTDVRFPDEAELIRKYGGVVWIVDRLPHETLQDAADAHCSEGRTDLYPDRVVRNDGTKCEFEEKVLMLYRQDTLERKFPSRETS